MQYGLKCWSDNDALLETLKNTTIWNHYSFIEIYVVPGTFKEKIDSWLGLGLPNVVIHAPHFSHCMNLSLAEYFDKNFELFSEAKDFCQALNGEYIILHLGTGGNSEESIRQIKMLDYSKIIIENKPEIAINKLHCVGTSPEGIKRVLGECGVGFCLDISHAIAYSAYHQLPYLNVLKKFIDLSPVQYHLCDGLKENIRDKHFNIGEGNYDFKDIFSLLPQEAKITLETPKKFYDDLGVFISEMALLKKYESEC